jgi:hypothetical protein
MVIHIFFKHYLREFETEFWKSFGYKYDSGVHVGSIHGEKRQKAENIMLLSLY